MADPRRDATVSLREITRETLAAILDLKVSPDQKRFVASNSVSIAQAHFYRDNAWFRAVYADDLPIGFVMLHEEPGQAKYHLWRFMIDQRYQSLDFGARALALVLDHVRTRPGATELLVSCVPGDGGPGPFYEKHGFAYTGEVDEGELVLSRRL